MVKYPTRYDSSWPGLVRAIATAERTPLSRTNLDDLLLLAAQGIGALRELQEQALAGATGRTPA